MGKGALKINDKISNDDFEDAIVTILKQVRPHRVGWPSGRAWLKDDTQFIVRKRQR